EQPPGVGLRLDFHPLTHKHLGSPEIDLWVTEGVKKADALVSLSCVAAGLNGVWGWRGENGKGGKTALPDWEQIALKERHIFVVFDSDGLNNPQVRAAEQRLREWLTAKGARVYVIHLPVQESGKVGVDDFLADGGTVHDLYGLAMRDAARPFKRPIINVARLYVRDQSD